MSECVNKLLSLRLAMRREDAEVLASSGLKPLFNENDEFQGFKKPDGEWNVENNVTMREDGIAVIHVDGALSYRTSIMTFYNGEDTYNGIEAAFEKCLKDESVKGIVFDINSPGGDVCGCADLADKIFNARGTKPYGIVARTGGMMCSAAYWLGSSCEHVYTASNGRLGSIGVLCAFTKFSESFMKTTVVVSDLSPDKSPSPDTPEGLDLVKKELNDLAEVFIEAVARNRGTTAEDVRENFGKGGVFVGANAVDAKLADGVMSIDDVCREMITNGRSYSGGAAMATNAKTAEATDIVAQAKELEAVKAQAVADYKAKAASINEIFAGLDVSGEEKTSYIDGDKTVADATAFALSKAKEKINALANDNESLKSERDSAKAEYAKLASSEKERAFSALEKDADAQNGVHAGAPTDQTASKQRSEWAAEVGKNFYNEKE